MHYNTSSLSTSVRFSEGIFLVDTNWINEKTVCRGRDLGVAVSPNF